VTTGTNTVARDGGDLPPGPRVALVVYHRDGAEVAAFRQDVPLVVGRSSQADLRVRDSSISSKHASFTFSSGRITVQDLGSTNGTWLRGQRIEQAELHVGDEITMGSSIGHIHAQGPAHPGTGPFASVRRPPSGVIPSSSHDERGRAAGGALLVGDVMRELAETVSRVAAARIPILLLGETGTGKEVLAHLIHERGPRRSKKMVHINCGAIPDQLVEGTLFGHERGAFTGASELRHGVFEEADGGTVLFDEIGELPWLAQAKLLRVLEDGTFRRVGGSRDIVVDVRVIAATNRNLEEMTRDRLFREDLYYRLNKFPISIPPLRERTPEIEPLAWHFLRLVNEESPGTAQGIDPEALALLRAHRWPGNVRELKNVIERAAVVAQGKVIVTRDLPQEIQTRRALSAPVPTEWHPPPPFPVEEPPTPADGLAVIRPSMRRYRAQLLTSALVAANWKVSAAARQLLMPPRTLRDNMKRLGIKKPSP
jgi:two-component system, NtrC family, response regulator AtoC